MREENALFDRGNTAHPLARLRPRISVTILRSQLSRNAPQLENWLALPFLRWSTFCNLKTPTAMHFNQCYELAASLFIHFRYVARNNLVYMHERWQADQFAISFNSKFQQFANATIDHNLADRANVRDQAILDQLLSSPANCNISSDMQRPAGPTSGSCNARPRTGTPPFAHFISPALLQSRRAGHAPSETIPAAIDSEQVEDTLSQTSDTLLIDLI
ncbi:hypothetical protein GGF49_005065 [Coemansia sp. RSA 1853]|nr:hypothetical protein LPJ76_002325 [Coemansia sp. RSA 638]KAJ2539632.1 hypothetical protein GGF49_005065 [Coemansia sp. RSA 1853]